MSRYRCSDISIVMFALVMTRSSFLIFVTGLLRDRARSAKSSRSESAGSPKPKTLQLSTLLTLLIRYDTLQYHPFLCSWCTDKLPPVYIICTDPPVLVLISGFSTSTFEASSKAAEAAEVEPRPGRGRRDRLPAPLPSFSSGASDFPSSS